MSKAALKPARTALAQDDRVGPTPAARQATRPTAPAFTQFELGISLNQGATAPADIPANDTNPGPRTGLPHLPRRALRLDPRQPMQMLKLMDWALLLVAAECAARWGAGASLVHLPIGQACAFLGAAGAIKLGLWLTESYHQSLFHGERGFGGLALGAMLSVLVAGALTSDARAAGAIALIAPGAALLLAGLHLSLGAFCAAAHRAGLYAETIVIVGATEVARRLAERANSGRTRVVAVIDDRLTRAPLELAGAPVVGDIETLLAWEGLPEIDRIIIAVPATAEARVRELARKLRAVPNRVDLLLDLDVQSLRGRGCERLEGVAALAGRSRQNARSLSKRTLDLVLGAALVSLLVAPMALIALAVKLSGKGPALVRQPSLGYNNRKFNLLKFRTLRHEPRATRATAIGGVLRATGIEDWPNLFNVLAGDLSLVGPRPHATNLRVAGRRLGDIAADYAHRHRVKPGLVGSAEIKGAREPMQSRADVHERLRLDLHYAARASFWLDLQILARSLLPWRGNRRQAQ